MLNDLTCWAAQRVAAVSRGGEHGLADLSGVASEVVRAPLGGVDGGAVSAIDHIGAETDVDVTLGAIDGNAYDVAVMQADGTCDACCDVDSPVGIEGDIRTARDADDLLHDDCCCF